MGNNKKKTQQITTVPTQCISQSKVEGEYVIGGQGVG